MDEISIEINGSAADIGCVWVHFQDPYRFTPVLYRIWVPDRFFREVFDPLDTREPGQTRPGFLTHMIESLGTFIFDAYIDTMGRILGCARKPYRWVIVGVDGIREVESGIELIGKAVPFDPLRYA